jgi:hypothetical protein
MKEGSIPEEVKKQVEAIVARFNQKKLRGGDCYYEVRFKGKHCYLDRFNYGTSGPICRLTYTGDMEKWDFAIFRWSSESYDPNEWMFPGSEHVDGTVEGAMKAGLEAYPA